MRSAVVDILLFLIKKKFSINMNVIQAYLHWVQFEGIAGTFVFLFFT
jgi:hypothetical protein